VQVDHFFPKAFFPFFSVHFANLVPLCRNCNLDKWERNPLGPCSGKGALSHTFMPFLKPAVPYMEVVVSGNRYLQPRVMLRDIRQNPSRCIENLDATFGLRAKWEDHLERWIREEILHMKADLQNKPRKKTDAREIEKGLKNKLRPIANVQEQYVGQWSNLLAQRGYARYALGNSLELQALTEQVLDNNAPRRRW
jgi:hypothetical protein